MKEFTELMKAIGGKYPNMRIGQAIINAIEYRGHDAESLFFMSDDELKDCLKRYLKLEVYKENYK